jgi:hypothetical protein
MAGEGRPSTSSLDARDSVCSWFPVGSTPTWRRTRADQTTTRHGRRRPAIHPYPAEIPNSKVAHRNAFAVINIYAAHLGCWSRSHEGYVGYAGPPVLVGGTSAEADGSEAGNHLHGSPKSVSWLLTQGTCSSVPLCSEHHRATRDRTIFCRLLLSLRPIVFMSDPFSCSRRSDNNPIFLLIAITRSWLTHTKLTTPPRSSIHGP